jgi:hypothetical protein
MAKRIKNTTQSTVVRCGQSLPPSTYYTIQATELARWQTDDTVFVELGSGDLVINDGDVDITAPAAATLFLLDVPGPVQLKPFATADGFRARFTGFSGTADYGTTTALDYTLSAERWIDGVELLVSGAAQGDYVNFQVVHPQAGVLDTFGATWYVDHERCKQTVVVLSYPARLVAGLIIRVSYVSVGTADVWVAANLRLHEKTA